MPDDPDEPWMLLDLAWLFEPHEPAHRHLAAMADAWEDLPPSPQQRVVAAPLLALGDLGGVRLLVEVSR
jgi:hypothetical protein